MNSEYCNLIILYLKRLFCGCLKFNICWLKIVKDNILKSCKIIGEREKKL